VVLYLFIAQQRISVISLSLSSEGAEVWKEAKKKKVVSSAAKLHAGGLRR